MIAIRIEMWPGGDEARKREIGFATIANVGGTTETGDYKVRLMKSPEYAKTPGVWKTGKVEGFKRRKLGPWDLLLCALIRCISARHDGPLPTLEEIEAGAGIEHRAPANVQEAIAFLGQEHAR